MWLARAGLILPRPVLRERAGVRVIPITRCSADFHHRVLGWFRLPGARNADAPRSPNHPHPTLSRSTGRGNVRRIQEKHEHLDRHTEGARTMAPPTTLTSAPRSNPAAPQRTPSSDAPLSPELLGRTDAYWRG